MNKDSSDVVEFMNLFARLREYCDDDPDILINLTENDESAEEVCREIRLSVHKLRQAEHTGMRRFAAPVDPKFTSAWRDYEDRFERVIIKDVFGITLFGIGSEKYEPSEKAEHAWEDADYGAKVTSDGIRFLLGLDSSGLLLHELPGFDERSWEDGLLAIENLAEDPDGPFVSINRRLFLVPFVQIPRHVASRLDSKQKLSLYKFLEQAQSAFVFGAPLAAFALMRTIMEGVLKDHYGAESGDLSEKINSCQKSLPKGASVAALHRLRRISNAVLHFDAGSKDLNFDLSDTKPAEIEIASLLLVLRTLIESAPQR